MNMLTAEERRKRLSPAQKHLIKWYAMLGLEEETVCGIMSMLTTKERLTAMLDFMADTVTPTEQEILKELARIVKAFPKNSH